MSSIVFNRQFTVCYGQPEEVAAGVRRIVANNPKDYTFTGTNTYIVGDRDVVIIDPGPRLADHIDAIARAIAGRTVRAILVTHSHEDHSPASADLRAITGAPVLGHSMLDPVLAAATDEDVDPDFVPDRTLEDGDVIAGSDFTLKVVHTPGHFPNHLCYSLEGRDVLFSGDHVMGWATTVIAPPLGDLGDYLASLDMLLTRPDRLYLPSHGPSIEQPARYVRSLIGHRREREAQIVTCLKDGVVTAPEIVDRLYEGLTPRLHQAAISTVRAHLIHLSRRGLLPGTVPAGEVALGRPAVAAE